MSESTVRVYLCECGPIIKDAIDLKTLAASIEANPLVSSVGQHGALCSEEGRAWLAEDLRTHPNSRVVVAGCSPREHGASFMEVCRSSGLNPYLLAVANIREQCTWVTPDRAQARAKASRIIGAAVRRAAAQEPLDERTIAVCPDALVIGSGVAGLTAAQLMARAGRRVYLVERAPVVGGRAALLGDVAPGLECASCMLVPLIQDVLHDPLIEVLTYSEVTEVLGCLGNFAVRINRRARHVTPDACFGCRSCHEACPVEVDNEFDEGLSRRKAVYIPYEGALPNASLIDEAACLGLQGQQCERCVEACPFGNIDLSAGDEVIERRVGAVILATGAEPLKPGTPGPPARAISAMALERLLSSAGPTGGVLRLPAMDAAPRSVALLSCTDADGTGPTEACSKVCCMAFAKYAQLIGEQLPECEIHQLSWERCAGGKDYREFVATADRLPQLHRIALGADDRIEALVDDDALSVVYTQHGQSQRLTVDLAVLAPRLVGASRVDQLSEMVRVKANDDRFVEQDHDRLRPCSTHVGGILIAGCASGPGDIQDAAAQGAAAAGNALAALVPGRELGVEPASAVVDPDRCGRCRTCVQVCPFGAISWDEGGDAATVNELQCRGCGSCVASCPTGALVARHYTDRQLEDELFALGITLKRL